MMFACQGLILSSVLFTQDTAARVLVFNIRKKLGFSFYTGMFTTNWFNNEKLKTIKTLMNKRMGE